jgi:hypothetical protein
MGEWMYSSTIPDLGTRWKMSGQLHVLPALPPSTHWIEDLVGPRAGLEAVEKRKILPLQGLEPQPSSTLLYRLSYTG